MLSGSIHVQRLCWTVCLLMVTMTAARAQVSNGSVAGQVTDPSGAGIPAAAVKLVNQGTGIEQIEKSDDNGNFVFPNAPAGVYTLTAEKAGFRTFDVTNLEIQVAQAVRQDVQLSL